MHTQMIEFSGHGDTVPGYLATPDGAGPFPAVVVIQEWWGLNAHIKDVAERFAQAGFVALSPDLYRGAVAEEPDDARKLAMEARTCRVIVNQAHCFANGGFFNNGMPFSLSMGCGSWGGNSIDENLNWRHFVNKVHVVRTIPERRPSLDEIFGDYWNEYGQ